MTSKNFIFLNEVESTNNYAKQLLLSKEAEDGTVVLAQDQKKGRGQVGNNWESENGKNLLASFIFFPDFLGAGKQFYLSKIVSLALVDFLNTEVNNTSIKWPNDIYIGEKKVAGILIENSIKGQNLESTIIGIGLNLNQENFYSDAPNPVSLKQITGNKYSAEEVVKILDIKIEEWFKKLKSGFLKEIDENYFKLIFRANQWGMYSKNGHKFEAKITGIGEFGQLVLTDRNGKSSEYMFKEIEFVI